MKVKAILFSVLLLAGSLIFAQNNTILDKGKPHKGQFFAYWGYNRASYSNSDMHFMGPQYNFTLKDVKAHDKPRKFSLHNYFLPSTLWVPQYNYRVGYWFTNNLALSFGLDHLKYVMTQNQYAKISGYINPRGDWKTHNTFNNEYIQLTPDFLLLNHTNGLNYLSFEVEDLIKTFPIIPQKIEVSILGDIGVGCFIPKSEVYLFGVGLNNKFHLAGWGASMMAGVHIEFWRKVFIRWGFKTGYSDLLSILTTGTSTERARQHFMFNEGEAVIGMNFYLFKHKKDKKK